MGERLCMRISFSQYDAFTRNHERYRLYYVLGLTPEGNDTPTIFNLGRRRGQCFHKIPEGIERPELVKEFGEDIVKRCETMREVLPDLGPLECIEQRFKEPIGDGKHQIIGQIDHIFTVDGHKRVGDFKTTKGTLTKKEQQQKLGEWETSPQSHFYLYAAVKRGYDTDQFTYHVIFDRKNKDSKP